MENTCLICVNFRSLIKLISSWTRTKIMLLQNIRHFCMLLIAPSCRVCFSPHLRNRPNNQSSLQLVPGLRLVFLILKIHNLVIYSNFCSFDILVHTSCSNNYNHYLKLSVPLSHTTFVVLNPIIFLNHQFSRVKMFCSNYVVE